MRILLRRVFCFVAGIDAKVIADCPATDRLWASHLGFSLLISFIVVFGISYHSTGYVLTNALARVGVSLCIALTIFMFDRALYQSDWFLQTKKEDVFKTLWSVFRIAIRLTISFGIAYILSLFLELAVFQDTITEKLQSDHVIANAPIYEKIKQYEKQLNEEIDQYRKSLRELEPLYQRELSDEIPLDKNAQIQFDAIDQRKKALDPREQDLRKELDNVQSTIMSLEGDMNAEEEGQRIKSHNSGMSGQGPKYAYAKKQKELYAGRRTQLLNDLSTIASERDELTGQQRRIYAEAATRRNQERATILNKREELRNRIELSKSQLSALEASRLTKVEAFRRNALAAADFQKIKDDPMARMTAYEELKDDPKHGRTILGFSFMTKIFVIFLEVVPVLAKMFFSPLTAYGQIIRTQVEHRARREAHASDMQEKSVREEAAEKELDVAIAETAASGMKHTDELLPETPRAS